MRKIKADVERLLLVWRMEIGSILAKYMELFLSLAKSKVVYSYPKFRKQNLMYFGRKHVESLK